MNRYSQNSLNHMNKVKEFTGWFIAILLPFTAKGLTLITHMPIISAYINFLVCGILLCIILSERLPYFKINIKVAKFESIAIIICSMLSILIYLADFKFHININANILINILTFGIFYGAFEQLVWINIANTAGAKNKLLGFMAVIIFETLMYILFWSMFIKIPMTIGAIFLIFYILSNVYGFFIFIKSFDITIWSILNFILCIVFIITNNFTIQKFLFFK